MTGNFDLGEGLRQIADVIGRASAMKLVGAASKHRRHRGRIERRACVYVPRTTSGSRLEEMIGVDAASKLAEAFGGETLHIGCGKSAYLAFRNAAIVRTLAEGLPVATVAWLFDLDERQIRNIAPSPQKGSRRVRG